MILPALFVPSPGPTCPRCGSMRHDARAEGFQLMHRNGMVSDSALLAELDRIRSGTDCDEAVVARIMDS